MSATDANAARAGQIAQQIVELLADQDDATQQRAIHAAMALLGQPSTQARVEREPQGQLNEDTHATLAEFFERGTNLKPADYAQLCAAFHYHLYGAAAFSLEEIRTLGLEAGVVLPDRLDKTFKSAAHKGKRLFQPAGRAAFRPTAAAGMAFNERWGVKPGRRTKVSAKTEVGDNQ
jgi:hypothetical protein